MKSANITSFAAPGTVVTYSYRVSNIGNQTLDPVSVTDPMPGLSAVSCHLSLAPGDLESCTATYTTTQTDVDNGQITNTGTAIGSPPAGRT